VCTAQILATAGADLIEVNLNDPHVHTHLAPFASAENLRRIVATMRQAVSAPLVVKLPSKVSLPLSTVTAILLDAGIPAMVCHTTSVNGELSQAQTVLHASHGKLDMIGVGGVSTGAEALSVLLSGVKAIQVASAVVREGGGAFTRLKRELADCMELRS
jgi:dihydroorotate dehydrogenase